MTTTTIISNNIPVTSQSQVQCNFQNTQSQPTFVIPWHSIVPVLTTPFGQYSPPPSELSPPLSAPPLPTISQVPAPILDLVDEEDNPEPTPAPTEDDDDVFEPDPTESTCTVDSAVGNKRRSQSLSSLQSAIKDTSLSKAFTSNNRLFNFLNISFIE